MADAPSYAELAKAVGISPSFAHEIVSGRKDPTPSMAALIFRRTGWRPKLIAALNEEQIEGIEKMTPRAARLEASAAA